MATFRGVFTRLNLFIAIALGPALASAEPDVTALKQAAGAYLYAAEIASQFERSRCGMRIQKNAAGFERAVDEIARHLPADDVAELRRFLAGEGFRRARRDNRRLLEEWFQTLAARHPDEAGVCEAIGSNVDEIYDYARRQWRDAKGAATKRQRLSGETGAE